MTDIFADTDTAIEILYRGRTLDSVLVDPVIAQEYNSVAVDLGLPEVSCEPNFGLDFNIPEHYKNIDIEDYIFTLAQHRTSWHQDQQARVEHELGLYKAKNLYPVLQLLIYIVDTMKKNNLVWGVGRGSSVASYCLYLMGVHKIDSIKYDLDIHEFLR